ncbi:hypothetical protein D3C72_1838820 [compost metagenome]
MPAEAGIQNRHARLLQRLGHRHHVLPGIAAFDQVEQGMTVHDDEVGADGGADAAHDLHGQAHAVLDAAAPAVLAQIRARAQELVQ